MAKVNILIVVPENQQTLSFYEMAINLRCNSGQRFGFFAK